MHNCLYRNIIPQNFILLHPPGKIISLLLCFFLTANNAGAQVTLSGTVYDSSRKNLVEGVKVYSTSGSFTLTDSMGKYQLNVSEKDSVAFIYQNKSTPMFAVSDVTDISRFDIRLHITVKGKYSTLKEVIVYARSYRQDSLDNRETYRDIFGYRKPGVRSSLSPDGIAGADINELINLFRFKRNRQLAAFQKRLAMQEKESYINYRFNKIFIKRITGLPDNQLDDFMAMYRPDYEFVQQSSEIEFNQYILNASYQYKINLLKQDVKK